MKKMILGIILLALLVTSTSCINSQQTDPPQEYEHNNEGLPLSASHTENDFVLSLFSDKEVYRTTDAIQIWATLEYIGNYDEVTIWHSSPSIVFTISDGNRFNIGGIVFDVLESTDIKRGVVYRFDYQKIGSWSEDAPDADFWRNFFKEENLYLPPGEYTITVSAEHTVTALGEFLPTENVLAHPTRDLRVELNIKVVE